MSTECGTKQFFEIRQSADHSDRHPDFFFEKKGKKYHGVAESVFAEFRQQIQVRYFLL